MKPKDITIILLAFNLLIMMLNPMSKKADKTIVIQRDTVYIDNRTEWASLVDALVQVESEGKPDAINPHSGASGILQLMPIYVQEVNRLIGEERYTLEDRFDVCKSVEMWLIYNQHKNPEMDVERAIFLHNPRAKDTYRQAILNKM